MNINILKIWEIFRNSNNFNNLLEQYRPDRINEAISGFNSQYSKTIKSEAFESLVETLLYHNLSDYEAPKSLIDAETIFIELAKIGAMEEGVRVLHAGDFKTMIGIITPISYALFLFAPDYFIPYFYQYKFKSVEDTFELLGLELPKIPKRTDYNARYGYYWKINKHLLHIRETFNLSPYELCVFLYDFIPNITKTDYTKSLPTPSQCWMIGGLIEHESSHSPATLWQTNIDTRKGDILVHYETAPVSAITGIWIAAEDAIIDPLSYWYSNTYITHRIELPHVSLREIQADEVLSTFPLVKKNFQGVNGYPVDSITYGHILTILENKGFDTKILPTLSTPQIPEGISLEIERDVEEALLKPLLKSFGLVENLNFISQFGIHVGRGHRIFPDFAINYNEAEETAQVVIEAKLHMKSRADIEAAFIQARSYAKTLQAKTMILCDKLRILVFVNDNGAFNMVNSIIYHWQDMKVPEKYNSLKKLICKK